MTYKNESGSHSWDELKQTINENNELSEFLGHPEVSHADKKDVIDAIFNAQITEFILNTLKLLIDRNRVFILQSLANIYHKQF